MRRNDIVAVQFRALINARVQRGFRAWGQARWNRGALPDGLGGDADVEDTYSKSSVCLTSDWRTALVAARSSSWSASVSCALPRVLRS